MRHRLMDRPWFRTALVMVLGGAAFLTNRHAVPLSFGLHLLFGGLFVMVAAILYGPWAGALTAVLSALPTVQLWGHSFALISLTLEGWVVGFEARRGREHHTETVLVYWLFVGGPVVVLTYSLGAHIPLMASVVAALKQAVNGLVNTATASVLLLVLARWQRGRRQMRLEILLANLITFLVLVPLAFSFSLNAWASGEQLRAQLTSEAVGAGEVVRAALTVSPDLERVTALVQPLDVELVITDSNDVVILSAWEGVRPGTSFVSQAGDIAPFMVAQRRDADGDRRAESTSLSQAERVAFVYHVALPDQGWQIYVRKPLGAVEYLLYRSYLSSFVTALALMFVLLVTIRLLSYNLTRSLVQLADIKVTPEGEIADLPLTDFIWVTEVRSVAVHLREVGARIQGLIQRLHETQRELQRNNVELAVANVQLADEALRDARTGLYNQRAFWQQVQLWVEENRAFTLVLTDVRGLDRYGMRHGHMPADKLLQELALELQQQAALHGGEAYQYAPERVALLFPESSDWLVERMTLTLPALVRRMKGNSEEAPVGLTVGGARFPEDGQTGPAIVEVADRRLGGVGPVGPESELL